MVTRLEEKANISNYLKAKERKFAAQKNLNTKVSIANIATSEQ
jgi:hypothetical protein